MLVYRQIITDISMTNYLSRSNQSGFAQIPVVVLVLVLFGLGVGGYLLVSEKTTEKAKKSDPSALIGLWVGEKSTAFPSGQYLEIKEKEFCYNWQVSEQGVFSCFQYAPYIVSEDLVGFGRPVQVSGAADSAMSIRPTTIWSTEEDTLTLNESGMRKVYTRVTSLPVREQ